MLTKRENMTAILQGKQPDYYGDLMDALAVIPDPIYLSDRIPQDGVIHKDSWGVEFIWPLGAPGKHPVGRPEGLVVKDIEQWREQLSVPSLDGYDWSTAAQAASEVNRKESWVAMFNTPGLFERSHHLMSLEEALVNYMLYEDEVVALLRVLTDFKKAHIRLAARELGIEAMFYQDDWGSKTNLFLPPAVWRRTIKPFHQEIVDVAHECGILFIHHADCHCQLIAEDMVEMGIDVWQGAIPQNDIVEIQRITKGQLPMIGGVDGPRIDDESVSEEEVIAEVHRVVDTYCPGGKFFPAIAYGKLFTTKNQEVYEREMAAYGKQWATEHPVE